MSELKSIIERVEAASGPDRELDGLIAVATFQTVSTDDDLIYARKRDPGEDATHPGHYFIKSRSGAQAVSAPAYTSSLDAVMALMPDGHTYDIGDCNEDNLPWACVTRMSGDCPDYAATGATVVLAWLSAILQARLAMEGSK